MPANRDEQGRYLPGTSGNPQGRPKGVSIVAAILRNLTEADADEIAKTWIAEAKRGKFRRQVREALADRIDGKPPIQLGGVTDDEGNERPIPLRIVPE